MNSEHPHEHREDGEPTIPEPRPFPWMRLPTRDFGGYATDPQGVKMELATRQAEGSCNACGRSPGTSQVVPPMVGVLILGNERHTTTVRLCPDCLKHLQRRLETFLRNYFPEL